MDGLTASQVKWDGMVNAGARRENTLRPVFNQSFYFPVRLLDPRERTSPLFRKVRCSFLLALIYPWGIRASKPGLLPKLVSGYVKGVGKNHSD